jgi:hypothetical protein
MKKRTSIRVRIAAGLMTGLGFLGAATQALAQFSQQATGVGTEDRCTAVLV